MWLSICIYMEHSYLFWWQQKAVPSCVPQLDCKSSCSVVIICIGILTVEPAPRKPLQVKFSSSSNVLLITSLMQSQLSCRGQWIFQMCKFFHEPIGTSKWVEFRYACSLSLNRSMCLLQICGPSFLLQVSSTELHLGNPLRSNLLFIKIIKCIIHVVMLIHHNLWLRNE